MFFFFFLFFLTAFTVLSWTLKSHSETPALGSIGVTELNLGTFCMSGEHGKGDPLGPQTKNSYCKNKAYLMMIKGKESWLILRLL